MTDVLIIGAGMLGTALGGALPRERVNVRWYDTDAAKCPGGAARLETAVPASRFIFMCVPSRTMRPALSRVAGLVTPSTVVVSLAKGLEPSTAKCMADVLEEVLPPGQPIAVLGGALLANEITQGLPGMGMLGCAAKDVAADLTALLEGSPIRMTWTPDAKSVAMAGVLKNVYALVLGIGDGLGLGSNARGWLFAQSVHEMLTIATMLRIDPRIILSVAGIGDLVATGLSAQSKNRTAGLELAKTGRTVTECEGIASLPSLIQRIGERPDLRLLNALDAIVRGGRHVRIVMQDVLYRTT
ncbi:MAG TPA: NAD(P)H-dependent glycerol-3-phosphate dehydrogenase [Candidatus Paceibacterota bacterium]|nr:NAD(P)H-dependent glycerol-3-phosphate dehydrogenase [Candidatus Paceibacterota bacterium]